MRIDEPKDTKKAKRQKKLRVRRKQKGLCTRCGKRKADKGFATCLKCRRYLKKVTTAWRLR